MGGELREVWVVAGAKQQSDRSTMFWKQAGGELAPDGSFLFDGRDLYERRE